MHKLCAHYRGIVTINQERLRKNKRDIKVENLVFREKESFKRNIMLSVFHLLLIEAEDAIVDTYQHILAKMKRIPCEGFADCIVKAGISHYHVDRKSNKG